MASARTIFDQAAELPPERRGEFVSKACVGDAALAAKVMELLGAYEEAGEFMGAPRVVHESGPAAERVGTRVGPYKLLELIGEGGFGSVYLAEQREPVARKVALKIIKLGMDTRAVIARFEAERQALALMEHPNIAKV